MKVDMSPEAVTWRLQMTSQLRDLCIALGWSRMYPVDERQSGTGTHFPGDSSDQTQDTRGKMGDCPGDGGGKMGDCPGDGGGKEEERTR